MKDLVLILSFILSSATELELGAELILFHRQGHDLNYFNAEQDVTFMLYTVQNPETHTILIPHDDNSLGCFDATHPTRLLIHGWISSADQLAFIKNEYLLVGNWNVIMVDWSSLAANLYSLAKFRVKQVGVYVASLLEYLVTKGVDLSEVHITGHSLGAHVAGIAGGTLTPGKLGKITGLDPAFPLYKNEVLENRLDPSDADFVQIIHTCSGLLGYMEPLGHADFYPNGGRPIQPGCGVDLLGACSHSRALAYFAESITSSEGFFGFQCSTWDDFLAGECWDNSVGVMGEFTDTEVRGIFYLSTSGFPPYASGLATTTPKESHVIKRRDNRTAKASLNHPDV